MILGRIAVGVIIFALSIDSYFAVEESLNKAFGFGFSILLVMSILFTGMALYILIQKGLI